MNRRINNHLFAGLGFAIENFDLNQEIDGKGSSITGNAYGFMRNAPGCNLTLLEMYTRIGYTIPINENQQLNLILSPAIAYYTNGSKIMDTTEGNTYRRDPKNATGALYLNYNQTNRTGLNFLVNLAVEYERKLGQKQRFSLTAALAYQQGFRYFMEYTGYMAIPGASEGIYTSKVNGTSLQLNLGMKYNFGFREKTRMLLPR